MRISQEFRLTVFLITFLPVPSLLAQTIIFLESGGQVVVEAENFTSRVDTSSHSWAIVPGEASGFPSQFSNFRGDGYVQLLPDVLLGTSIPLVGGGPNNPPSVNYKIRITTPGTYRLYVRWASHDNNSDSFYASIVELSDGTATNMGGAPITPIADFYRFVTFPNTQDFATTPWTGIAGFEQTNACCSSFEVDTVWSIAAAGDYTVRFRLREDGAAIDAFILQLDTLPVPTLNGPPASDTLNDADGDGVPDAQDICPGHDDSIDTDGDGIPDGCDNLTLCGDGLVEGDEECDDGNALDGDCCSATCLNEPAGSQTCGLGACEVTTAACAAGVPMVCTPGVPTTEVCDALDNDCNGIADDGLGTTTCGLGECDHTIDNCIGGVTQVCDPLEGATPEVCDGLDNDCDGTFDEDFVDLGAACTLGLGQCEASGVNVCTGDGLGTECDAIPGIPSAELCDGLDNDCNGLTDEGFIDIHAATHTVGSGSYPGSTKDPLVGIEVCAYDKSAGSCAVVTCGGISHQHYECIATGDGVAGPCTPVACCTTDDFGECTIEVPPGDYIVISGDATKTVLPDPLGVSASDLACGQLMKKHVQQIVKVQADGLVKKWPGKTTRLTGSELLIIEPEYVIWDDTIQEYPFVFETIGDWGVATSVTPPEGFVADYDSLSVDVDNTIEAVQFVITEVGSDLAPTETTFEVSHNGQSHIVHGHVGIMLTPAYAQSRGFNVALLRTQGLIKEHPGNRVQGQDHGHGNPHGQ